ncbi:nuclease-related domain-containing protein [Salibacterium aidingense]|uniref:nuclease-related domain-containing protein n=1 Tax=Salibacterium aidingense TaxID=384933 RepID=UPI00042149A3|nr:nuclease-related domain-containing protein [Salibacterium aidingense]
MIKKHRTKPAVLRKLQILQRRLPPAHPKRPAVEKETAKYASGYRGEQALDYHLSFINPDYPIFHDLRLFHRSTYFQIDTLLLTPFFILLIEVKNMAGTLIFDADRYQMIRRLHGEEEGFLDPRLQVSRHQLQLEQWGRQKGRKLPPILTTVAISFPSTIIIAPPSPFTKVIHAAQLPFDISELEKQHPVSSIPMSGIASITSSLIQGCHPKPTNIMKERIFKKESSAPPAAPCR